MDVMVIIIIAVLVLSEIVFDLISIPLKFAFCFVLQFFQRKNKQSIIFWKLRFSNGRHVVVEDVDNWANHFQKHVRSEFSFYGNRNFALAEATKISNKIKNQYQKIFLEVPSLELVGFDIDFKEIEIINITGV